MIRPPYILAFAADTQGCGYNRVLMPLAALVASGLAEGRLEDKHLPPELLKVVDPDVIVFQRQTEDYQIEALRRTREALPKCHIVYEIDDLLSDVPDANYHKGAIGPNMDQKVAAALRYCDAATVTTPLLKRWLEDLGGKNVHVIPNLVPGAKVRPRKARAEGPRKLRVGWGGGMSHMGDLRMIEPAIKEIGDAVEWVFQGFTPQTDVPIEAHDPVPPDQYLDKLYSHDIDLFLAPLEFNEFNEAKSSLRLVESGACCGAVIAQGVSSYHENSPPVFAYCRSPEDWTREIKRFIALTEKRQLQFGTAMQSWVKNHYTFESRMPERARAWLPPGADVWSPKEAKPTGKIVYVSNPADVETECVRAAKAGDHVMWVRPGAFADESIGKHLMTGFIGQEPVAAVIPLSTDGLNAFPRPTAFTPIDADTAADICETATEANGGMRLQMALAFGPCVLMRSQVLAALGPPNPAAYDNNMDAAMMEWTARAALRRLHCLQLADVFVGCVNGPVPLSDLVRARLGGRNYLQMANMPTDALAPQHRESMELGFFRRRWDGLRPGLNELPETYPIWASLKRDFAGEVDPTFIQQVKLGDEVPSNVGWTVFVDERVTLRPGALARFSQVLRQQSDTVAVVYADHEMNDYVSGGLMPCFKPDFDFRYFQGHDYVTPVMAIHTDLVDFVRTRAELFHVVALLALVETPDTARQRIVHLPDILGSVLDDRPAPERIADQTKWSEQRAEIWSKVDSRVSYVSHPKLHPLGFVQATYPPVTGKIMIIVPTRGDAALIQPCVNMILQHTDYPDYEILVVGTAGKAPDLGAALDDPHVSTVMWDGEFNWSAVNNWAAAQVEDAEYLCFLNDDCVICNAEWLSNMASNFFERGVGVVGARLMFAHGAVQHTGMVSADGLASTLHRGLPPHSPGYQGLAGLPHETSAVSGTCLLTRAHLWRAIKFDEKLAYNFNDIAFCQRVRERGYRVVAEMRADLHHREGATRSGVELDPAVTSLREATHFHATYGSEVDSYWNPNLELKIVNGQLVGTSYERPKWQAKRPDPEARRVLFVNDRITKGPHGVVSHAIQAQKAGAVSMAADLSGIELSLTAPSFASAVAWDIRNWRNVDRILRALGVDEVVLCSLTGGRSPAAVTDALRSLSALGFVRKVSYAPFDAESVCPRRDMMVQGSPCGEGYREGVARCQGCVNEHGSPFGQVDVNLYWHTWGEFLKEEDDVVATAA